MPDLHFRLFGKFAAVCDKRPLKGLDAGKDQELLSFLLIRRSQPHSREALAAMLWGENSTERSKKYLRQSLWHLQAVLDSSPEQAGPLLIEHDWLRVNPANQPWSDVEEFEQAFATAEGTAGQRLNQTQAQQLKTGISLYHDDLLAGWYQDWVLFERERLQNKFLLMLDKLIAYSQAQQEYELGQSYAQRILEYDPARERTHRELMQLFYLAGDRTSALRQYERCVGALDRELDVRPERQTTGLYEQMKSDRYQPAEPDSGPLNGNGSSRSVSNDIISCLKNIQAMLAVVQQHIQRDIRTVECLPQTEKDEF